jgi:multimeric flavodoxin WrbA
MTKNILILTGSPRKGGNSDLLADAFIVGAQQSGHTTVKYVTAAKDIKGCKACKTCFSKGIACSFPDDFNELAPFLEQADMVVFATPLYWFSFPVQLKAAIDKFYSFLIGKRTLKIKECVLLVCGVAEDEAEYEGIVKSYELIADYQKWIDRGILIVPGVNEKGDILKTDGLIRAENLGKSMISGETA